MGAKQTKVISSCANEEKTNGVPKHNLPSVIPDGEHKNFCFDAKPDPVYHTEGQALFSGVVRNGQPQGYVWIFFLNNARKYGVPKHNMICFMKDGVPVGKILRTVSSPCSSWHAHQEGLISYEMSNYVDDNGVAFDNVLVRNATDIRYTTITRSYKCKHYFKTQVTTIDSWTTSGCLDSIVDVPFIPLPDLYMRHNPYEWDFLRESLIGVQERRDVAPSAITASLPSATAVSSVSEEEKKELV